MISTILGYLKRTEHQAVVGSVSVVKIAGAMKGRNRMGYLFELNREVCCSKCGYKGEPTAITRPDPLNPEDSVIVEMGCPKCQSAEHITIKESD